MIWLGFDLLSETMATSKSEFTHVKVKETSHPNMFRSLTIKRPLLLKHQTLPMTPLGPENRWF